jgi:hypothetical protein
VTNPIALKPALVTPKRCAVLLLRPHQSHSASRYATRCRCPPPHGRIGAPVRYALCECALARRRCLRCAACEPPRRSH